jgi:cytochrome b involved in lipid metabolism
MHPIAEEASEGCCCAKSTASVASTASASTAASTTSPRISPLTDGIEDVDLSKVSCDEEGHLVLLEHLECDMCPFCDDVCQLPDCPTCTEKRCRLGDKPKNAWTKCEVRRHCTLASAWLVVGTDVIDCTPFLFKHPAGVKSILRKAGGADCTEDFNFHSNSARKLWKSFCIGTLVRCPGEKSSSECGRGDCTIM